MCEMPWGVGDAHLRQNTRYGCIRLALSGDCSDANIHPVGAYGRDAFAITRSIWFHVAGDLEVVALGVEGRLVLGFGGDGLDETE